MKCVNCGTVHDYSFCPVCGEKADTPKITFKSIFEEGFSTLTSMNKGFLFNVKSLLLSPNQIVRDYLRGKRKGIFNPVSFLIISITIFLVVDSLIVVNIEVGEMRSEIFTAGFEAGRFIKLYFKYFWVVSIIWLSVATKLLFGEFNFAEHLAINSFVIGQSTLIGLLGFVFFQKMGLLFNPLVYSTIIWMTYQIFKRKDRDAADVVVQSIGSTLLFFVQLILIVALIGVIRSL